jgi:uncharacterized protein (TIGR01627 family)
MSLSGDMSLNAAALAASELTLTSPPPLCPTMCSRERSFVLVVLLLCVMVFTFHEVGRNSDQSWYPTSMMSLRTALATSCVRTEAALQANPLRTDDAYWAEQVAILLELQLASGSHGLKAAPARNGSLEWQRDYDRNLQTVDVVRRCNAELPCNVLVFGVEWDALLVGQVNWHGSQTVFLEDNYRWETVVRKKAPCMETFGVFYHTKLKDWPYYLESYNHRLLDLALPHRVLATPWDVIIVRGPAGDAQLLGAFDNPGRMQSLYAAAGLAQLYFRYPKRREHVDVLVFDTDRIVEKRFSERFLGADNRVGEAGGAARFQLRRNFAQQDILE